MGVLAWQHNLVTDWAVTRGYHPPAAIQSLAQEDTMTAYARRLFYVNKPRIEGRDAFNKRCSSGHDEVAVLGCYTGNRQGIFLYDVTDARLNGIQQVTAAHEMLHQAYDRLGGKERARVDAQLVAYSKTVTDPDLKSKMAAYQKSEPNDIIDEMHSVFGTEVADLPKGLEVYYARYFTNRKEVTQFHDHYQAAFSERTKQIAAYDAQIESLKKQIGTDKASIQSQEKSLQAQRAELNALLSSNQVKAYNDAVASFNAQVTAYKAAITETNRRIGQYNKLIDARNEIAVQEQQLQRAIDSQASSVPAQ
jgi:hypothetical protein